MAIHAVQETGREGAARRRVPSHRTAMPRWHLVIAGSETPASRRGAQVIPFPAAAARHRRVVTYPQPIRLPPPPARPEATGPLARLGRGMLAAVRCIWTVRRG